MYWGWYTGWKACTVGGTQGGKNVLGVVHRAESMYWGGGEGGLQGWELRLLHRVESRYWGCYVHRVGSTVCAEDSRQGRKHVPKVKQRGVTHVPRVTHNR